MVLIFVKQPIPYDLWLFLSHVSLVNPTASGIVFDVRYSCAQSIRYSSPWRTSSLHLRYFTRRYQFFFVPTIPDFFYNNNQNYCIFFF